MRNVKVRAIDDNGLPEFEIDGVKAQDARLHFAKGAGGDDIAFILHDDSGHGLRFDADDPIWVDEDGPCPPSAGITTDQLSVKDCKAHRLSLNNSNSGAARELRYQLNFISAEGSRHTCDPIIQNGGGGGGDR